MIPSTILSPWFARLRLRILQCPMMPPYRFLTGGREGNQPIFAFSHHLLQIFAFAEGCPFFPFKRVYCKGR